MGGLVWLRGGCVGLGGRSGGRRRDSWKGSKSRVWRIVDRVRSWVAGKGRGAGRRAGEGVESAAGTVTGEKSLSSFISFNEGSK